MLTARETDTCFQFFINKASGDHAEKQRLLSKIVVVISICLSRLVSIVERIITLVCVVGTTVFFF